MNRTHVLPTSFLALYLAACATPNFDFPREPSYAIDPETDTLAKREIDEWLERNSGPSGFYPLVGGTDALGARLRFIEAAEATIDAQYFLMKSDAAGFIFSEALLDAADRGVRVRFLIDDVFTTVRDEDLAVIDGHPNIELRLFNPISRWGIRGINFLSDFRRANRRMHNKSLIVDNQAAIVGGRNIADEYFELRSGGAFLDFDMVAIGPVAADVSKEFDLYWNHERSLPLEAVTGKPPDATLERFRDRLDREGIDKARAIYKDAVDSDLMRSFEANETGIFSAEAVLLTDSPDKLVNDISEEHWVLVKELAEICRAAESQIIVITPYFVPGANGIAFWKELVDKGVHVVVITNSLASNNHTAVHSGYAPYRRALLRAGVDLREVRSTAMDDPELGEARTKSVTLHTKAMIFDQQQLFVGSLNLDPRSIEINSEMGLVIDCEEMVRPIAERLLGDLGDWTYRVVLDDDGDLEWHARVRGEDLVKHTEPNTSCWKRCVAWFMRIAPERQL